MAITRVSSRCSVGFCSDEIKCTDANETFTGGIFCLPRPHKARKKYAEGRAEEARKQSRQRYPGHYGQMLQTVGLKITDGYCQRTWLHDNVRISEQKQLAVGSLCATVQGVIFPEPACRQFRDVYNLKPCVFCRHLYKDGSGLIGRAVIQNDEFEIGILQPQKRLQCFLDFSLFVSCRDNHGNPWQMGRGMARHISQRNY